MKHAVSDALQQTSFPSALDSLMGAPLEELPVGLGILAAGYLVTLALSGVWVRFFVGPPQAKPEGAPRPGRFDTGSVIGKCENILALTFILANEATGLALIVAAKSLVRKEDIQKNPGYFLGGTLVNLVWSVLMGFALRIALVVL